LPNGLPVHGEERLAGLDGTSSVPQDPGAPGAGAATADPQAGRVLVVDDDALLRFMLARMLSDAGHTVEVAQDAESALKYLESRCFDAVIADVYLPGMDGLELARTLRDRGEEVPVLLMSGTPRLNTALLAIDQRVQKFLVKPVRQQVLKEAVADAVQWRRSTNPARGHTGTDYRCSRAYDLGELGDRFRRALESAYVVFQPLVRRFGHEVFAYEGLVRTREPTMTLPTDLINAAERLHRVHDLGRVVRAHIAEASSRCPAGALLFVNLHPFDFADEQLYDGRAPLGQVSSRVVFEITERCSLESLENVGRHAARLRALGYRLAIDDLGAGYTGLPSFTLIEPEVVKIDMALTRGVEARPRQQILIRSIARLASDLGAQVVAEGVETAEERDMLEQLGCELMQGYLFAHPAEGFPAPRW